MDVWQQLGIALALVFVLEGLMPFLVPGWWRGMIRQALDLDDGALRLLGLCSMLIGLGLLYLVH